MPQYTMNKSELQSTLTDVITASLISYADDMASLAEDNLTDRLDHKGEVNDTGALARGFKVSTAVADPTGVEVLVYNDVEYAPYVEFGTLPHTPPFTVIYDWVVRKLGISDEVEAKKVAWKIVNQIKKHGTPAQYMLTRAKEEMKRDSKLYEHFSSEFVTVEPV